ncbi:thioredoxin-like domain-containing protein [Xylaria cubensis]|nr:thioredoxin-like domain-containing protein [Xylaria cubensis]
MKFETFILLISPLLSSCSAWKHTSEQDFRRAISGHSHALVACETGSRALESEWMSIAGTQKSLISIDCLSESALCDEFGVISYPALRYFDGHGHMKSYRGPRRASAIASFLKRAVRPAITVLDADKSAKFQSVDETVLIGHINPRDEHVATILKAIASQYQDRASFGSVQTEGTTTIVCYNNRDEQKFTLSDLTAIDALPKLLESCMASLIGEFTRANEMKYLQSGKSLVLFFGATLDEREAFVKEMRPVAKMYKEYLSFVTVDADEYADFAVPLGLTPGVFPALAVQNPMYGQTFPYPSGAEISPETVGAFVMDIVQGKVNPWDGESRQEKVQKHDEL